MNNDNEIILEEIASRVDTSEGWMDIFLKIVSDTKTEHSHVYIVKGLHKGKIVGFQLELSSQIGAGFLNGRPNTKGAFVSDAVKLTSIGQMSDDFVKALSELYLIQCENGFTKSVISSTVYSLNSKSVNLEEKDVYKLKLFLKDKDDELYAELFLNINTLDSEVELHEKDKEYRENILKIISMSEDAIQ